MIESRIVKGIPPCGLSKREVAEEFRALVCGGVRIRPAGLARSDPSRLLSAGYMPRHRVRLFDTIFYLSDLRYDDDARFFVAYVLLAVSRDRKGQPREIFPRYFYKDASLIWRSASHFAQSESENWIGKGDLKRVWEDGQVALYSAEETTNLPFEIQPALDLISRKADGLRRDRRARGLVLRKAPDRRVEPYRDFSAPRRRAASEPHNLIHRGKAVAWFTRRNDPTSLRFAEGYAPDFARGILEVSHSGSRLYGGEIRKFRVLSRNKVIQYQFVAAPRQVWVVPPQALTVELSSYGVRTIDVHADEDLFVPGYEYHYLDDSEDPPRLCSQIPDGFAGEISAIDPARADASPWLEKLPIVQEFRRAIRSPKPHGRSIPTLRRPGRQRQARA
ncbi:MAG TPA: hypothetical protein VKE73_11675 [Myxococcota bacterium]|nr:hypothetical protein [Myxococcota bacterium]